MSNTWIFQGNPKDFDIDDYLARYPYIYWGANKHIKEIKINDIAILWRAGKDAGMVGLGIVREEPVERQSVNYPDALGADVFSNRPEPPEKIKVGIELSDVRLDHGTGLITREFFKTNNTLKESNIIRAPQGTVFRVSAEESTLITSIWNSGFLHSSDAISGSFSEGHMITRTLHARERSRSLIESKKRNFANVNNGQLFCEVCKFDFSKEYPSALGKGFIEVHHLDPISNSTQPRKTTMNDLILVCSNCHRMIHRNKDVDKNLKLLMKHFAHP